MNEFPAKMCVVGLWHLGCVTAAGLSSLGHDVTAIDSAEIINDLNKGKLPIQEPGLSELLKTTPIRFSADYAELSNADFIYITFDTDTDKNGNIDLTLLEKSIEKIIPLLNEKTILIISSQIPIGKSQAILDQLRAAKKQNEIAYIPENLRLGNAINTFMHPERIIVGVSSDSITDKVINIFGGIKAEKIVMDLKSAEMVKHAMNSYLATLIAWSSEISDLCEATGANAVKVMQALKAEGRVSKTAPIMPGLGFGGGTLARDVTILRTIGASKKIKTVVLDSVMKTNENRTQYVHNKLLSLLGSLSGKTIAFLGLTYKPNTSTLRGSLTLQIIDQFRGDVVIKVFDPAIKNKIATHQKIILCDSAESVAKNADALIIMTDWDEFKKADYSKLAQEMKTPILIDTKNMLCNKKIKGVRYYGIGI